MAKLVKNLYKPVNSNEKKLNCYLIHLSKKVVEEAKIKDNQDLNIYAKGNKIIIENK